MHAAHRVADDQAHVLEAEPFGQQAVLPVNHILVIVFREFGLQSVGGLRRFAVADGVGKDDEIFLRIERLALAKELARKGRGQQAGRRCRRCRAAPPPARQWLADGPVGEPYLGQDLAGVER